MTTTTLDAAIEAALVAHKMAPEACNDQMRVFVGNIIAHIADHMTRHITSPAVWMGYSIALDDLREIAGIEGDEE
jgi:hypothetical protein